MLFLCGIVVPLPPLLKVYDVSQFVARHPGGMEQIMMGAGRDVTQLFESYHPLEVSKYEIVTMCNTGTSG